MTNIVTSQPELNSYRISTNADQPPTYEEVISEQPKPSTNLPGVDSEVISNSEDGTHSANAQLHNIEQDTKHTVDEQRRNNRRNTDDCCFVCFVDDEPDWIFCKLFSDCCLCLAHCTESCCEGCADCLHNCCESSTQEQQTNAESCCADNSCSGNGESDDCNCDCSCFD